MANVIYPNFTLAATNDTFSAVWKLTRALKKAGWTYKCSSSGSSTDITGVATADTWGGLADPSSDTYPSLSSGAWWGAQGPSTIKIPIGSSAPAFVKGEKITQTTSGAEGEIVGVSIDTGTSTGYLVVLPRVGTFNGSNLITGFTSAATVTPSATPIEFVRNIVFWYNSTSAGHIYYQAIDISGESTYNLFSASRLAAVTNTICPGGNSSGANTFPTVGTFAVQGTGGTGAVGTGSKNWSNATPAANYGAAQIMVANAAISTGVSADGSFTLAFGTPNGGTGSYVGFAFLRCDNNEDGDVDPFIWFTPNASLPYSNSYSANTAVVTTATRLLHSDFFGGGLTVAAINYNAASQGISFRGFRRRGMSSGDTFQEFTAAAIATENINGDPTFATTGLLAVQEQSSGSSESAATMIGTQLITEPIWVVSFQNSLKMRKGIIRWWYFVQGGNVNDTYDSKKYIQLSGTTRRPVIAGPWDGSSTPTNA